MTLDFTGKRLSPEIQDLIYRLGITAKETLERNEKEEALEYYNAILKIQFDNTDAWENKCAILNELGYYDKTIVNCDEALKIIGDNAAIWKHKGYALNLSGDYSQAMAACQQAINLNPTIVGAYTSYCYALVNSGFPEKGLEVCDIALSIDPEDEIALINRAWALNRLTRNEEALSTIEKALKYHPNSVSALNHKCKILFFDFDQKNEALFACNEALQKNNQKTELWNLKANILYALGDYKEASQAAWESFTINPTSEAGILFGKASMKLKDDQGILDAMSILEYAINMDPSNIDALIEKGRGSLLLGRYDDAVSTSLKVLEMPTSLDQKYDAYLISSEAYYNLNRNIDALRESGKALDIYPKDFKARMNYGRALSGLGDYSSAVKIFQDLIGEDNSSIEVWLEKAHALYGLGQLDEARIAFDEVIRLSPKNIEALNWKGKVLGDIISSRRGSKTREDYSEAFQCWEQSIKLNPQNPMGFAFKGMKLSELGEYQEARECYEAVDNIIPDNPLIKMQMGRVEGIIETEENYKDSLKNYRTELLEGSKRLVSDTTTYLAGLLRDFRFGLNMVMAMFAIQFFVGIVILTASLYYSAIGKITPASTILGITGGLGLIVSMMILSPMKLQKNRVDFSQWMMAYSNWSNTFFAVNDLYARKALGEDKGVKWEDIKSLHDDLYKLTENTIIMVEKNCEFTEDKNKKEE
jgi:tetratricopeptide (TPR) repeat protein